MPVPFRNTPEENEAWFASEPDWMSRVGDGWKGTRFLGRGSKGVAGLWEYQPKNDPNAPAITQMVVKMSELDDFDEKFRKRIGGPKTAKDEGIIGEKLAQIGSPHLVRQYGGNRIGDEFSEMGRVVKLFLEYCPGGDLEQFFPKNAKELKNPKPPINEYTLWSIFRCMALAITALDRGTEDIKVPAWNGELNHTEFMHCDLKMDNGESPFRAVWV
jgi:serine/threonine protein kinase